MTYVCCVCSVCAHTYVHVYVCTLCACEEYVCSALLQTSPTHNLCRVEHSAEDQRLGRTWQLKTPPSANVKEVPDPDLEQVSPWAKPD